MTIWNHRKFETVLLGMLLACGLLIACDVLSERPPQSPPGKAESSLDALQAPGNIPWSQVPGYVQNLKQATDEVKRLAAELAAIKAKLGKVHEDDIRRIESILKSLELLTAKIEGMEETRLSIEAMRRELADTYYKDYASIQNMLANIERLLQGFAQRRPICPVKGTGRASEDIMGVLASFLASWGVILTIFGVISNHTMQIPDYEHDQSEVNMLPGFFREPYGIGFIRFRNVKIYFPFGKYYPTSGGIIVRLFIPNVISVIVYSGCLLLDFNIILYDGAFNLLQIAFFSTIIISIGSFIIVSFLFIIFYMRHLNSEG